MKLFTEHPRSIGETYFQHLRAAFGFGGSRFSVSKREVKPLKT